MIQIGSYEANKPNIFNKKWASSYLCPSVCVCSFQIIFRLDLAYELPCTLRECWCRQNNRSCTEDSPICRLNQSLLLQILSSFARYDPIRAIPIIFVAGNGVYNVQGILDSLITSSFFSSPLPTPLFFYIFICPVRTKRIENTHWWSYHYQC